MFSFFSNFSFFSRSSNISNLIEKLNKNNIISCCLGMSKINFASNLVNSYAHPALLLLSTSSEYADQDRGEGILIEYGEYSPDMSKEETKKYDNKEVLYRYDKEGGLRYYGMEYKKFVEEFGSIGYISMDIDEMYQKTFENFIDLCAPTNERKWIKSKYSAINYNCQNFAAEALEILRPKFVPGMIQKGLYGKEFKKKIDIFPNIIKNVLNNLK